MAGRSAVQIFSGRENIKISSMFIEKIDIADGPVLRVETSQNFLEGDEITVNNVNIASCGYYSSMKGRSTIEVQTRCETKHNCMTYQIISIISQLQLEVKENIR